MEILRETAICKLLIGGYDSSLQLKVKQHFKAIKTIKKTERSRPFI